MAEKVDKVRENRARRWATRLGLQLAKSRAKRIHADNFGGYMIIDASINGCIQGSKFDLSIEEVEEYLAAYERNFS